MKDKLIIISDDLNHDIITELEARKQLLILLGVSQQRELLEALAKHIFKFKGYRTVWTVQDYVDHFLASNCG